MLRKWRIGVVGSGMISEIYLQNLVEKFEETEVLGVWSPREHSRNVRMLQFDFSYRKKVAIKTLLLHI